MHLVYNAAGMTSGEFIMLRWGTLIAFAGFFSMLNAQQPAPQNPVGNPQLQPWQGSWQLMSAIEDGDEVAGEKLKGQIFFVGVDAFLMRQDTSVLQAGNLQLNPGMKPPTVNAVVKQGVRKDSTMLGIYSLKGDTLKICFDPQGRNRPQEFASAKGAGHVLATYQRVRGKNEEIDIVGVYTAESGGQDGKTVESTAVIERRGDSYLVTYKKDDKLIFVAVGIRQGDTLSLSWTNRGQVGVSSYKIEAGPKLVGQYTTLGGPGILNKEVLSPVNLRVPLN
jgi:uncharacterized protein (TIGR03067 family)